MSGNTFGILLVDDHTLYREGLRELFGHWEEFKVVGEAGNGQEAIEFCRETPPDIVLMDVQMPGLDGVEAARIIHQENPDINIVMLTVSVDEEFIWQALRNGVKGYLLKDTPGRQLRNRLQGILKGEAALSGVVTASLLKELRFIESPSKAEASGIECLTENELQVLKLVAQGLSNVAIGEILYQSEGTVKKELRDIMHKLQLENRVQVAVFATRHGLAN